MKRLWKIIEKEKIPVRYKDLSSIPETLHGLYIYHPQTGPLIILGNHLEQKKRLHKCILAEEIGHFYTAPRTSIINAYRSSNLRILQSQDERKALQWATDFLIPDAKLKKALHSGCRSCFELAEYFDVTEWFMLKKLELMQLCSQRMGLKVKGRDMFDIEMAPCVRI